MDLILKELKEIKETLKRIEQQLRKQPRVLYNWEEGEPKNVGINFKRKTILRSDY